MNVILDSNQFISDLHLKSQRFQVLANYLERTNSQLWLLEPVFQEVAAHYEREVSDNLAVIQRAVRGLTRLGVNIAMPSLDEAKKDAVSTWREAFLSTLEPISIRLPFDTTVVEEAFARATMRLPPCKPTGGGMRDAIIWLSAIKACKDRMSGDVAFISRNTKDFAASGHDSFRSELQQDLSRNGAVVHYFPSLKDFNRGHSDRISHITVEWILERVSMAQLQEVIKRYMSGHAHMLRPASMDYRDLYEPWIGEPHFHTIDVTLSHFYVWELEDDRMVLSLATGAFIEADVECWRIGSAAAYSSRWDDVDDAPPYKTITCHGDIGFDIAAVVQGDAVVLGDVEDSHEI